MRSPSLGSRVILGGIVAISLSCSGGDGGGAVDGPDDDPDPQPQNYPGVPAGTPVTVNIGVAGGTVTTADGAFSIAIPAGALTKATDVTVRPLVSTAPNGFGVAYHIDPTGLKLAHPATITLQVAELALGTTPADWVGIGMRNTAGAWFGDIRSTAIVSGASGARASASVRPSAASASAARDGRVVSVTRVESSDGTWAEYSVIAFWAVLPLDATVEVSSSIALRALACLREVETNGSEIDSDALPALPICQPSIRQATWRINGIVGGNSSVGLVSAGAGNGAEVLYIAPSHIPSPNPVTAVVSLFWPRRNVTKVLTRSPSTITIVGKDYVGTASGTVSSALTNVGAIYDYTAKITWTREGALFPGAPVIYRPHGYVKYTPRNRCVSNMQPDSITISPLEATLEVNLADQTWSVGELAGLATPAIQYFDTCAKMPSYLEVTAAPYIQADGSVHLPVTGQIKLDYGIKITGSFSYLREGEATGQGVISQGAGASR